VNKVTCESVQVRLWGVFIVYGRTNGRWYTG
jgi:hypothetical protein